jgi:hypothetical protein
MTLGFDIHKLTYYTSTYNKLPQNEQEGQMVARDKLSGRLGAPRWRWASTGVVASVLAIAPIVEASARPAVSCGGAALLGGAQLLCSHVDPKAPVQSCTFSWALATAANQTQVVSGSFLLAPGASNVQVYQGAGFIHAMSGPIVLCQGKRRVP